MRRFVFFFKHEKNRLSNFMRLLDHKKYEEKYSTVKNKYRNQSLHFRIICRMLCGSRSMINIHLQCHNENPNARESFHVDILFSMKNKRKTSPMSHFFDHFSTWRLLKQQLEKNIKLLNKSIEGLMQRYS